MKKILFLLLALLGLSGCIGEKSPQRSGEDITSRYAKIRSEAAAFAENVISATKDSNLLILQGSESYPLHFVREIARENGGITTIVLELGADRLFQLEGVRIEVILEPIAQTVSGKWYAANAQSGDIMLDVDYRGQNVGTLTGIGVGYQFTWTANASK